MDTKKTIRVAMANRGIDGVMELVEVTGLSYDIVNRAIKGDGTVKVKHFTNILNKLGYNVVAVPF
jgi:hypothetical protein